MKEGRGKKKKESGALKTWKGNKERVKGSATWRKHSFDRGIIPFVRSEPRERGIERVTRLHAGLIRKLGRQGWGWRRDKGEKPGA